jgi:hypothetical protein
MTTKKEYETKWYEHVSELNALNYYTTKADAEKLSLIQAGLKNIIDRCSIMREAQKKVK